MTLGALYLPTANVRKLSDEMRGLKTRHGLKPSFEIKWTKVSPAKSEFYHELLDLYLKSEELLFRAVLASKDGLDHARFNQTHDDWYYKIYFQLLRRVIVKPDQYRIFLDIKDAHGHRKIDILKDYLLRAKRDASMIHVMQPIQSRESSLLQLCDFITGAVSQANNEDATSETKMLLVRKLQGDLAQTLKDTTPIRSRKMNVFHWTPT